MWTYYPPLLCYLFLFLFFFSAFADNPQSSANPSEPNAVPDTLTDDGSHSQSHTSDSTSASASAATSAASDSSSERKKINYKMTETQYCSACHSLVEEFYRWTLTNVHRNNMNISFSHSELMENYCRHTEPFFKIFHDFYQQACLKLIQDHHKEVLAPFMGEHKAAEFLVLNQVYSHKIAVCERVGACRPLPPAMIENSSPSYSDCDKCERFVYTGEKLLRREKLAIITATRVRNYVNALCQEIGLHFRFPLDLDEYCRDQQEEYGEDLQQKFIDFFLSDSYNQQITAAQATETGVPAVVHLSQTSPILRQSVCVELTGHCAKTKEEKKSHKAHDRQRIENLKKKQAKNPFAPKAKAETNQHAKNKDQL